MKQELQKLKKELASVRLENDRLREIIDADVHTVDALEQECAELAATGMAARWPLSEDALYLIGAWERGADVEDYWHDIADFRRKVEQQSATAPLSADEGFEAWKESYGLVNEPNYSADTEADCLAAYAAGLAAAGHTAVSANRFGDPDAVGNGLDDVDPPLAGAITLLETVAEFGARAFEDNGQPTSHRLLCLAYAKALRKLTVPSIPCIHKKTGNVYRVVGCAINATNAQDGQPMVIYERDGLTFVRKSKEFEKRFKIPGRKKRAKA